MPDTQEEAATNGEVAASTSTNRDPSPPDTVQNKVAARIGLIGCLTDIAPVEAFRARLAKDTGATVRASSLKKLLIEVSTGQYVRAIGSVRFDNDGTAMPSEDAFAPTEAEATAITEAWKKVTFPEYQPRLYTVPGQPCNDPTVPWSNDDPANIAVCFDKRRQVILCVEQRKNREDGHKDVFIWTHWSDEKWRIAEPPDALPLFGLDTIGNALKIMVHEGPKAAKAVQALIADDDACAAHPWGEELRGWQAGNVAHVAWLGGAERPDSTDWSPLAKSSAQIIIVCDNDDPGRNAVPAISRRIGREMWMIQFDDRFPAGFDLANPIPNGLFREVLDVEN